MCFIASRSARRRALRSAGCSARSFLPFRATTHSPEPNLASWRWPACCCATAPRSWSRVTGSSQCSGGLGVAARRARHEFHRRLHVFSEAIEHALTAAVLILLGAALPPLWPVLEWRYLAVGLLLLIVVRPAIGWLSLAGASLPVARTCARRVLRDSRDRLDLLLELRDGPSGARERAAAVGNGRLHDSRLDGAARLHVRATDGPLRRRTSLNATGISRPRIGAGPILASWAQKSYEGSRECTSNRRATRLRHSQTPSLPRPGRSRLLCRPPSLRPSP